MINEPSNDKIQGVTLGVAAAAKLRVTENERVKDWETRELNPETLQQDWKPGHRGERNSEPLPRGQWEIPRPQEIRGW